MSIIHGLWLVAVPNVVAVSELWLLALVGASIAVAIAAGAIPPRNAVGPQRMPPDRPAWLLGVVLFTSLCVYIFTASLYSAIKYPPPSGSGTPTTRPALSPADNAFLSTVPGSLAFLTLLLGDRYVRRTLGQNLRFHLKLLPVGLLKGIAGVIMVVPPLFVLEQGLELAYRAVHFQHPAEHPLLHVLGERPNWWVTAALIFGACVIAPLFEEFLFRGHLQTVLRQMLYRMSMRRTSSRLAQGEPVIADTVNFNEPFVRSDASRAGPKSWQSWGAILLTSVLFASVHPAWSQPIIFVLAICLGYAYERTGNLWVPITIHAVFNSISTALFLMGMS